MANKKKRLCDSCIYGTYISGCGIGCNYLCLTGHSRGCDPENCARYVKGDRIKLPTEERDLLILQNKLRSQEAERLEAIG